MQHPHEFKIPLKINGYAGRNCGQSTRVIENLAGIACVVHVTELAFFAVASSVCVLGQCGESLGSAAVHAAKPSPKCVVGSLKPKGRPFAAA